MPEYPSLPHPELPEQYRESLTQLRTKAEIVALVFKTIQTEQETLSPTILPETWEEAVTLIPLEHKEAALAYITPNSDYPTENDTPPPFGEFLGYLIECLEDLSLKQEALAQDQLPKTTQGWATRLSSISRVPITPEAITRIVRRPFSISFVLTSAAFDSIKRSETPTDRRLLGFHISGTVYNIIRQQTEPYGELSENQTIDHENIHNILSTTQGRLHDPLAVFAKNPDLTGSEYVDCLQEEMLAQLRQFEIILQHFLVEGFDELTNELATAGSMAKEFVKELETLGIKGHIVSTEFKDALINICNLISETLAAGRLVSPDESRQIEALLFILKPSQYRHIPTYLDVHFGPQLRQQVEKIKSCSRFFTLNELAQVTQIIQDPDFQSGRPRDQLSKVLEDKVHLILEDLPINVQKTEVNTPEEIREYCQHIDTLAAYYAAEKSPSILFLQAFMMNFLSQQIDSGFVGLVDFYQSLEPEETYLFLAILGDELPAICEDLSITNQAQLQASTLGKSLKILDLDTFFSAFKAQLDVDKPKIVR